MPNSYTAVPSIIPGNLTVNGDITGTGNLAISGAAVVTGNSTAGTLLTGASQKRVIASGAGALPLVGVNLLSDGTTRSNAGFPAYALLLDPNTAKLAWRVVNAAGTATDLSPRMTLLSDYVQHANTGNTTENTIYTKVIRGGLLGANGGIRITLAWLASVQGGVTTNVRIRLNGLTVAQEGFALTGQFYQQTSMINQGAANAQLAITIALKDAGVIDTNTSTALGQDTSVDSTLTITAQNGTATDNQFFRMCEVELLNTFGPV